MLIIIEGHDKAGKTTLAERLSKELNIPNFKHHRFTDKDDWNSKVDFMGEIEYNTLKHIDFSKVDLIVDRFFMSNLLYNEYYDRGYDNSYIGNIYKDFPKENVIYVNVSTPNSTLDQRYKDSPDEFIPLMQIKNLRDKYNQNYSFLKYSKMNIELINIDDQIGSILDQISKLSYKNALIIDSSNFNRNRHTTLEKINLQTSFYIKNYDSFSTFIELIVKDHVEKYSKQKFVQDEEIYYNKIINDLSEKIEYNRVNDIYEDYSRRIMFASTGCISYIQILKQTESFYNINIYFRSSEAIKTYPIDLSMLVSKLLRLMNYHFGITKETIFKFNVMIGSSHRFLTSGQNIDQNLDIIISAWKTAVEFNDKEIETLKTKYDVAKADVKTDEYTTTYKFAKTNIEFEVPHDGVENLSFADHNLTGDAFEFANEHFSICQKTFDIVSEILTDEGFNLWHDEEYYNIWVKSDKRYEVPHYCKDKKLISVTDEKK